MTTQNLRYFIDLVEAVERGEKRPMDPELSKAISDLEKTVRAVNEEQLDEVNWKKVAAAGAIGLSALFANLAHAAPNLIDTTNNGTIAGSCQTILMQASMNNGLNAQTRSFITQASSQFQQIANDEFQQLINRGDIRGAQAAQAASNKTQQKLNNLSPQERSVEVLRAGKACLDALR